MSVTRPTLKPLELDVVLAVVGVELDVLAVLGVDVAGVELAEGLALLLVLLLLLLLPHAASPPARTTVAPATRQ
jgi:hypothetical protein